MCNPASSKNFVLPTFSYLIAAILFLLFSLCGNQAVSSPQIQISTSPLTNTIQQPTITALLRDRDGLLWVGTQHGLYRFDGVNLTKFSSGAKGNFWIPNSNISRIIEDSNGRVIASTYGGDLIIWNAATQAFTNLQESSPIEISYAPKLALSGNGRIWAGGREGLFWFDELQGRFVKLVQNNESGEVSTISSDQNGIIYVAYDSNLYMVTEESNSFSLSPIYWSDEGERGHGRIMSLTFDHENSIYIGTDTGHLISVNLSNNTTRALTLEASTSNSITSLIFFEEMLWMATNNGLFYTDKSLSILNVYLQNNSELSNNHVTTLFGEEDLLWVGTFQGLNIISLAPFETFDEKNSLVSNDVLAFLEDPDHKLWIGTFDGLYIYDETSKTHKRFSDLTEYNNLKDRRIMTMSVKGDEIWLGFWSNGIQVINTKTLQITTPPIPELNQLEVTKILHAKPSQIWIATFGRGLLRFEGKTLTSYLSKGLPERTVKILLSTKSGKVIASSDHNIYAYDKFTDTFSPIMFDFGTLNRSPMTLLSISENQEGDLWIGTEDRGIFIWEKADQLAGSPKLTNLSDYENYTLSTVYGIEFDDDGNAWCSTQSGVTKLDSHGNYLARFTRSDGLQGSDFNFGSSYKDSQGRIYFGGSKGYSRFFPRDIAIKRTPPKLLLTKVTISRDGRLDSFDAMKLTEVQLTHKDYFVQFDFSVLDFRDTERNQYRYMLEGFDRDWIENGTRNSATFTSLPPGDYVLRIQGANSAGVWNRKGISLAMTVLPPPWFSWWAYTLYALSLLFLSWLGKRAYDSYVIEKRAREMAIVMVETEERADDEMQEQLEIHDDLVKSVYQHSVSTLNLVSEIIAIRGRQLSDDIACEVMRGSVNRVTALALLEDCLYYQNELLLADLHKYTNILVSDLLKDSPIGAEHITTINEVSAQPFPIEQASPLAIMLYELLENCIQHAFEEATGANYIHIILAEDLANQPGAEFHLTIQDNGAGIPANLDPLLALTPGFAIVASMARRLPAKLRFAMKNGTWVSIIFPRVESR